MVDGSAAGVFIGTDADEGRQALGRGGLGRRLEEHQHLGGQQQPHPRDADQQSGQVAQIRILVDQAADFGFQGLNVALQLEDSLFMELFGQGVRTLLRCSACSAF